MSIRAGQILFSADNGFIIDRITTGGVNNVNVPQERVYELGNYQSVGIVRDIPDLSFQVETGDVSYELENLVFGGKSPNDAPDSGATPGVSYYDFANSLPIDIISPFRSAFNAFNVVNGVAIPQLFPESVSYKFGVRTNSSETWNFRGDSVFYIPGSPYLQQYTATAAQTNFTLTNAPILFVEKGINRYALNVSVNGIRKFVNVDYTETSGGVVTFGTGLSAGDVVRIVYGSTTPNATFPTTQGSPAPLSVKPSAVRGKDIDVYIQVPGSTPDMVRWDGVQQANLNWSVNLQPTEEFGNYHYVEEDYVTPMVKGDITVLPSSTSNLFAKIAQAANVATNQVAGVLTSTPVGMEVRVSTPDTGAIIKTLYVPDARFIAPAIMPRANQKLTVQFRFESDTGAMACYPGYPAGATPLMGSGFEQFTV